ncbi:response regulator [Chloroflexota bacterium]
MGREAAMELMDKIKVLIVDDHPILREGIRALIDLNDDIEVVGEAAEGNEAIEKARELSPDVVLMDLAMPTMEGTEATCRIIEGNPEAKVLVMSQYDSKESVLSVMKAGAAGYVPKRALGSELVSAIRIVHRGDLFLHPSAATALIEDYLHQSREDPYDSLTGREREILKLVAEGRTSQEVANRLAISVKTVFGHRTKLRKKLGLHSHTDLVKYAIYKGLVSDI